jgi:hypothetical protein
MPETIFDFFDDAFYDLPTLIIYLVGASFFAILLISSVQNYNKNRSYSIGAIVIISYCLISNIIAFFLPPSNVPLLPSTGMIVVDFMKTFLAIFGLFISISIAFFYFLSCIRMA